MGHTLMGSDSNNNQRTLQRQSKHPPGRRKMVGFDVQRLASASNRDGGGAGVVNSLRPSKDTPTLFTTTTTTRQLHKGVTPTMFSDLVDIIHKKQGVLVLNKGSPTPATDRTFTLSMPTTTSRFPFDRKIHLQNQGSSIHFTQ